MDLVTFHHWQLDFLLILVFELEVVNIEHVDI